MQFIWRTIDLITRPIRMVQDLMKRFAIGPRNVMGLSLPARLALFLAVCLLLTVVAVYFGLKLNQRDIAVRQWWGGLAVIATLVIITFNANWNAYYAPYIFINTWEKMTLPLGITALRGYMASGNPAIERTMQLLDLYCHMARWELGDVRAMNPESESG